MIRACRPADEGFVLAAAGAAAGLGPRLWVDWHLWRQNPAIPYRFYRAGEALLEVRGPSAWLAGPVADEAELLAFLAFAGVDTVTTAGWHPPGWAALHLAVMQWGGEAVPLPDLPGFSESPPPGEVAALLAGNGTLPFAEAHDRFYSELCTRLNHGYARVYGVFEAGELVSTAGAYSIAPSGVSISGVETRPEARGRGLAAALVARLCQHFRDRQVSLICKPALAPYYEKLGFAALPAPLMRATKPKEETK